jgi:hypothetical protein
MANYKHYMNSNYAGCRLLAETYDRHRNRDVRIYALPGLVDVVGITDGVDKWIAPARNELFSVPALDLLRDPSLPTHLKRARAPQVRKRVKLAADTTSIARRRVIINTDGAA